MWLVINLNALLAVIPYKSLSLIWMLMMLNMNNLIAVKLILLKSAHFYYIYVYY